MGGAHSASPSQAQVAEVVTMDLGAERGGADLRGGLRIVGHEGVSMHFECPLVCFFVRHLCHPTAMLIIVPWRRALRKFDMCIATISN